MIHPLVLKWCLRASQQSLNNLGARDRIRRVRQHDGASLELLEEPPKGLRDRVLVGEGGVALGKLLGLRVLKDGLASPVQGQPFQKVVALHVAVVVPGRRVWRVEIDDVVFAGVEVEDVAAERLVRQAAVEDRHVVLSGALPEVVAQWQVQVATAVVVAQVSEREDPAWLLARGGQNQG